MFRTFKVWKVGINFITSKRETSHRKYQNNPPELDLLSQRRWQWPCVITTNPSALTQPTWQRGPQSQKVPLRPARSNSQHFVFFHGGKDVLLYIWREDCRGKDHKRYTWIILASEKKICFLRLRNCLVVGHMQKNSHFLTFSLTLNVL